jgi:tetratricopeptide (TPR) repeat protein
MGVVLAAYDARLDRRVALKLLLYKRSAHGSDDGERKARQVREAMAMARLSHPNVVSVYDAGSLEDGALFIAMEYVQGPTLGNWCKQQSLSWRVVLEAYLAAGRGLAAAHAAGLVHRDFKPDNVLVGQDGRVRVTDFGLARQSEGVPDEVEPSQAHTSSNPLEVPLTEEGAVLGTPAYMAPEQFRGVTADARSDQFSFAVSLWEALYSVRPFEGQTPAERRENVLAGRITSPPSHSKVPPWVHRALLRALDPQAQARYPSLAALLTTLERDPAQVRRRWLSAVALFVLAAGSGGLAWSTWHQRQSQVCTGASEKLQGVWDAPRQTAIEKAFLSTQRSYAQDTWARVREALNGYTAAWVDMHRDSCEATRLRGEQSEAVMTLRMACLERRRWDLVALTEVFTTADATVVEKAVFAASALPPLRGCADVEALLSEVKPPEDAAARHRVEAARAQLARVKALAEAGKYKDALELATEVERKMTKLGYKPVHAEALFMRAWSQIISGESKDVPPLLTEALWLAQSSRHDTLATAATVRLMGYYGLRGSQEQFEHWEHFARAMLDRLEENGELRAVYYNNRGLVFYNQGAFAEAFEAFDRAFTLAKQHFGPANATTLRYATNALAALGNLDRVEDSQRALEALVRMGETSLGATHPSLTQPLMNLSNVFLMQGRLTDARQVLDRVEVIGQQAYRPSSEEWAHFHLAYGDLESEEGRAAEALTRYERSARLFQERTGLESPEALQALVRVADAQMLLERLDQSQQTLQKVLELAKKDTEQQQHFYTQALLGLANLHGVRGQNDQALRLRQEALELRERYLGPKHYNTALIRQAMADSYLELNQPARALVLYDQVLARFEENAQLESPNGALFLAGKGEALRKLGRVSEALPLLEQALRIIEKRSGRAEYRAYVQFVLARALLDAGQQTERVLRLATAARTTFARAPRLYASILARLDALLETHSARQPAAQSSSPSGSATGP